MNGIWKKKLKRFLHDVKGFAKDEEVAKIKKAVVETTDIFNLDVDKSDFEELLDMGPKELIKEEVLRLEQ